MKQGVTRPETPRDRREREALEEDLRGNPLAGAPLRRRVRNFRPDADAHLAALGAGWDFREVNALIERHTRHYPTESRLPMNPRTGDFVLINGQPYTRKK